jgi:hypothetical protein
VWGVESGKTAAEKREGGAQKRREARAVCVCTKKRKIKKENERQIEILDFGI